MSLPPTLQPNDPIRAAWHNRLRDEVSRLLAGQVSGATQGAIIAAVLAALPAETLIRVRITAVHVPVNGGPTGPGGAPTDAPPYFPSGVKYDYEGIGYPGIVGTMKTPDYGRPVHGDEARIWPAALGSVHYVLRAPEPATEDGPGEGGLVSYFVMIEGGTQGETVARKRCDGGGVLPATGPDPEAERKRIGLPKRSTARLTASGWPGAATVKSGGEDGAPGNGGGV